ncbi:MAG: MazG nucleotide pyrophosphohydrolase domain-containing protein [Candidatus Freyarchaeota archaeon]|nr:MazG nucleotide pyrophosphohydrolase domain-containing protein [Candidatus Freyarchaeota archaeon]MDO8089743.1 MazG nucleotide pyrophosphohydrolase domain-containing protein [Candidatus Sigynarchaeota archaeon]
MEIREFQKLMRDLYFENDKKRGRLGNFVWLVSEIGELARVLKAEDEEKIREEIADVFAWLASLANVLEIDLEEAVQRKYPGKCPRCGANPCECEFRM